MTGSSIRSWTSYSQSFEAILLDSHLYRRALKKSHCSSTRTRPSSVNWSILSGFSLSQVSNIAVFHLAVSAADLSNPECYTIVPRHSPAIEHEEVRSKTPPQIVVTRVIDLSNRLDLPVQDTRLCIASQVGDHETVRALLEHGANIEARDEHGNTSLHRAAGAGHHEIVRFHLESGADVEAKNGSGRRPLHVAAARTVRRMEDIRRTDRLR